MAGAATGAIEIDQMETAEMPADIEQDTARPRCLSQHCHKLGVSANPSWVTVPQPIHQRRQAVETMCQPFVQSGFRCQGG